MPVGIRCDRAELELVKGAAVFIRTLFHAHDVTVGPHRIDDAPERRKILVHIVDLRVQTVDLILHGDQFVANELAASAGQESGRQDACYDVSFHFHGLFSLNCRTGRRPVLP